MTQCHSRVHTVSAVSHAATATSKISSIRTPEMAESYSSTTSSFFAVTSMLRSEEMGREAAVVATAGAAARTCAARKAPPLRLRSIDWHDRFMLSGRRDRLVNVLVRIKEIDAQALDHARQNQCAAATLCAVACRMCTESRAKSTVPAQKLSTRGMCSALL